LVYNNATGDMGRVLQEAVDYTGILLLKEETSDGLFYGVYGTVT